MKEEWIEKDPREGSKHKKRESIKIRKSRSKEKE